MIKKITMIYTVLISILIVLNLNSVNGVTSGDFCYDIKSDDTITITKYTGNSTDLSIPSYIDGKKVTELGEKSFEGITSKTVIIPNTITSMGQSSFYCSYNLETVVVNANVEILPNLTFYACTNLKNVTLNSSIKELGMGCFFNCTKLTDLSFLSSIKKIGKQCFDYCTSLTTVVIPENVTVIERRAFYSTVKLDLSNTRLVEVNPGAYAVATQITTEGIYNYDDAYEILQILNNERVAKGLSKLKMDADLLDAAMLRTAELSVFYSHTRPTDLSCFSASEKMYGENIAYGNPSSDNASETVMDAWMNSPGHRANILGENYTTVGIGCFYKDGVYYWAQCFGTNELDKNVTKPANSTGEKRIYVSDDYIKLDVSIKSKTIKPDEKFSVSITNNDQKCNANCATWTSSDKNIATVDSNGNIKGIKNGNTKITVKLGSNVKIITVYVQKFDDVKVNS